MRERDYQTGLIKRIKERFPGCEVLKNDTGYRQGFPDLTILHPSHWAVLEVKPSADAPYEPNQEHYLEELNKMHFAATIFPENENEVLDAVEQSFKHKRSTRVSKSKQLSLD